MKVDRVCRHRKDDSLEVVVLSNGKKCVVEEGAYSVGDEVSFKEDSGFIGGIRNDGTIEKEKKYTGVKPIENVIEKNTDFFEEPINRFDGED